MSNKLKTGYLNYFIDLDKNKTFLNNHKGLENMFISFKPKSNDRKQFMTAYKKFLTYKDKNESQLVNYNFTIETLTSENFGTKTFYKTNEPFFWAELFEYYWLVINCNNK